MNGRKKLLRSGVWRLAALVMAAVLALGLAGCGAGRQEAGGDDVFGSGGVTLRILSGSENRELAPILERYAREKGVTIVMDYQGSLDIMRALQAEETPYDAVWPASSLWISAGDTHHRVKHAQSVSVTPVIFGIRESLARQLGFVGREVSVGDILAATRAGELSFCMTSATQSNSGCSAYIGFLYAMLGSPDVLTADALAEPALAEEMQALLAGVDRSSGSSDWLKDLFLAGDYDAMVNYECLIISANRELEAQGRETLYAVYPYDGLSLADSPLGYVDGGSEGKEQAFLDLQAYLLSGEVQDEIQRTGRRTGYEGVSEENREVFRADWGLQPDRVLSPIRMPASDVLFQCLDLYQTSFRKPSLTVYCLDYSGSMEGEGSSQLVDAMAQVLIQENAARHFLQASQSEVNIVIPFASEPLAAWAAVGNGAELEALYAQVESQPVGGGTDLYAAVAQGLQLLEGYDLSQYTPAVIVMSDGMSGGSMDGFLEAYERLGQDVPVFSILFGEADPTQLEELARATNGRVFDGREDLVAAFRSVKGYN